MNAIDVFFLDFTDKSTNQQQSGKMSPIPNDYISFEVMSLLKLLMHDFFS